MKVNINFGLFSAVFPILLYLVLSFIFGLTGFESYSLLPYLLKQSIFLSIVYFYYKKFFNFDLFKEFNINLKNFLETMKSRRTVFLLIFCAGIVRIVIGHFYDLNDIMPYTLNIEFFTFMLLGGIFIAPFIEEIIFRGILLSYFVNKTNLHIQISSLIVGTIFGLMHYQYYGNLLLLGAVIFLGYLLCVIVNKYDNLVYAILIHFVNNLLGTILLLIVYLGKGV
ncbi:MAG: CPBP family intramembrane glutamic endopeptidase [Nanoarchaeota archaeon]